MASIWAAVRWWDEWQMRILISGSLFIQWFLLLAAPMRKYTVPRWFRVLIWLAYISCDALAIYALATLFNRQAKASSPCYVGYRASSIEVLWAPILLIHLGGREEITAFDIEDNELWTRQTVTLVSQVTVAIYAFYKTWPSSGDNRLLWSAIVLFVIGILSFCEKPWALRRASINRLVAVSSLAAGKRKKPAGFCEFLFTEINVDHLYVCGKKVPPQQDMRGRTSDGPILSELDKVQMILSDLSLLAADTDLEKRGGSASVNSILEPVAAGAEKNMKNWLKWAFGLIYTRANVVFTPAYLACHVVLVPSLHVAAIVLFATSHKQAYRQFNATDVRMTYIVLCLTAVLDVFGLPISELFYYTLSWTGIPALCETLAGHNLIDEALETKKCVCVNWLLNCLGCNCKCKVSTFFDCGNKRDIMYLKVAGMVLLDLVTSGKSLVGLDLASYRSPTRDKNWTLGKLDASTFDTTFGETAQGHIAQSLRSLPFDVSVLRWHIATDLCFRSRFTTPAVSGRPGWPWGWLCFCWSSSSSTSRPSSSPSPGYEVSLQRECAQGMSNYMAHLLSSRPDMLMTGSRKHLFVQAMEKASELLDKHLPPVQHFSVAKFIEDATAEDAPLVHDACVLAAELMELQETTRWEVIYRVWMGMLCYSASMCRGYLHAKSLGEGGEFLSFLSLVIALKGGKTLADKLQMPDHGGGTQRDAINSSTLNS